MTLPSLPARGSTNWFGWAGAVQDLVATVPGKADAGDVAGKAPRLAVVGPVTGNGALAANTHTPVDATSGARAMTLPSGQLAGTVIIVEKIDASANAVTISGSLRGSASTEQLTTQYESRALVADSSGSWHPFAGHKTWAALKAALVPKWQPSTAYTAGDYVLNPSGQIVSANATFTSGTTYSASNWTVVSGGAAGAASLTPTATKTAAYTAVPGDLAMMNVPGGATTLTLPTAPADKAQVGYRAIGATTAVPLVINRGGSTDTIGTAGATSANIVLADETVVLQYNAANTRWLGVNEVAPLTSLDGRFLRQEWIGSWSNDVYARPHPEDTPTLAWAAAMTTGLTSPVSYSPQKVGIGSQTTAWDGQSDPNIRIHPGSYSTANGGSQDLALYGDTKPGGVAQAANWPLIYEFVTSAGVNTVEITGYSRVANGPVMIEVNGQTLAESAYTRPIGTGNWMLTLAFPTAKARIIRVYMEGAIGLTNIRVPTGQTISKPVTAIQRRVAIIGDSYVNGANPSTPNAGLRQGTTLLDTFAPRLARLLGADAMMLAGIGSTGWVAGTDTGGGSNAYATRLSAVLATNPHILVFYGSINDGSAGTGVQAAVASALASCSAVPKVYVIGPLLNGYDANNAAVKAATLAAGRTFIDLGSFLFGSGKVDAVTGDGNRDLFLLTDGAHPNVWAHKAIARAAFNRMQGN